MTALKLSNRPLLLKALGQCDNDNENSRLVALDHVRKLLKSDGYTLQDLLKEVPSAPPEQSRQRPSFPDGGPYYHDPVVKTGLSSIFRKKPTKRVIRNTLPPSGLTGRFRILADQDIAGQYKKITGSFETDSEIYEPFYLYVDMLIPADKETMRILSGCSRTGTPLKL